jgi:hypothetical protein
MSSIFSERIKDIMKLRRELYPKGKRESKKDGSSDDSDD